LYLALVRNDLSCAWNSGSLAGRKPLGNGKPLSSPFAQGDVWAKIDGASRKTKAKVKHGTRSLICMMMFGGLSVEPEFERRARSENL
jgi:hypothetical protein